MLHLNLFVRTVDHGETREMVPMPTVLFLSDNHVDSCACFRFYIGVKRSG